MSVAELIRGVVAELMPARATTISVLAPDELTFEVEPTLIASAVGNLVQNALKYSRPGGRISVQAHELAGQVQIDVSDECGGLSPELEARLFAPFQRGSRGLGTGLGLSIVKEAVAAHGGSVAVHNRQGEGCTITTTIPAVAVQPAAPMHS